MIIVTSSRQARHKAVLILHCEAFSTEVSGPYGMKRSQEHIALLYCRECARPTFAIIGNKNSRISTRVGTLDFVWMMPCFSPPYADLIFSASLEERVLLALLLLVLDLMLHFGVRGSHYTIARRRARLAVSMCTYAMRLVRSHPILFTPV